MEVESRGFKIHYTTAGGGPALLLLPEVLMSSGRWRDLRYFDLLAEDFRVIAVDPLGHGESDKPHQPEHYTEPEVVEDLVAVLDRDGAEQVHVWGYGRGAHHAFLLALHHPQRVLTVTAGGYTPGYAGLQRGRNLLVSGALRAGDWPRAFDLLEIGEPGTRAILMDNDPGAVAAALEMTGMEQVDPARVRRPAFLYAGSKEPFLKQAREDAERMDAKLEVLEEGAGTAVFDATDTVLPMVLDHLGLNSRS